MTDLVVVGVDGGSSNQAVGWAIEWALARHASLEFLHALSTPRRDPSDPVDPRRRRATRVLARAIATARDAGLTDVRVSVADQPVAAALVAASQRAGLLVIGRRETAAVVRRRSNSVSRHLSRYSSCPVVVVPETAQLTPTRRIALLLNGEPGDRAAMDFAFEQATATGAEIRAIHAWREPERPPQMFSPLTDEGPMTRLHASELLMAEELAGYGTADPDIRVTRTSVAGSPDRALLSAASRADLIVLPAHVPIDEMLAPGEPELVALRHASCPVVYAR